MPANRSPFRVAIVPGVNPGKWTKAWSERYQTPIDVSPIEVSDQRAVLMDGRADVAFVRLPIVQDDLSIIRLYEEVTVVVVPAEHPIALYDSVTLADLEGETVRAEPLEDAIDLVVAGVGILVLPYSIARQHARKDLAMRPVTDAPLTEVAVAWVGDATTAEIDEFIGIVRGRTAFSSRGATPAPAATAKPRREPQPTRKAQQTRKTQPKRPRRSR